VILFIRSHQGENQHLTEAIINEATAAESFIEEECTARSHDFNLLKDEFVFLHERSHRCHGVLIDVLSRQSVSESKLLEEIPDFFII
jgi:hypothetical protein